MSLNQQRTDRVMSTIFGQLEMLQELSLNAGDTELANDLSASLAGALARYCDRKRQDLAVRIDHISRTG